MAAIDFPSSPANGATFTPATGITYRYVTPPGIWTVANGPVDTVIASDLPPANPVPNQLWFNAALAMLYVYYDDGNTQQWVPSMPLPAPVPPGSPAVRAKVTRFIANGTFTPDPLCVYGYAEAKGGGGGGETRASIGTSYMDGSGGGGEGARGIKFFVLADIAPSKAVTIGAGGAASAAGGTTSLGALLTAEGGKAGGSAGQSGSTPISMGGAGGTVVVGDIAIPGARGVNGMLISGVAGWGCGGVGGGSGGGAGALVNNVGGSVYAGGPALANSGGGGGGGAAHTSAGTMVGGAGGSGYLHVVEYLKA